MMKKIMIRVIIALGILLAALLLYATTQPAEFRVERSLTVNAPADSIRAFITDFHRWTAWSPYEAMDPNMKRSYSGNENGVGAVYTWTGEKVGSGRMEVLSITPEKITIKLDFTAPFEASNTAEFILEPQGSATRVTWAMYGPNSFIGKIIHIFFDMDTMVGKDFETGLKNLDHITAH